MHISPRQLLAGASRLQRIAVALILLLLLMTAVAWAISYRWPIRLYVTFHHRYALDIDNGSWQFNVVDYSRLLGFRRPGQFQFPIVLTDARKISAPYEHPRIHFAQWPPIQHGLGYSVTAWIQYVASYPPRVIKIVQDGYWMRTHAVPCWVPFAFLGICALIILCRVNITARTREKCIDAGLCLACGYDLRATPHRCPECGAVPGPRKMSAPSPNAL